MHLYASIMLCSGLSIPVLAALNSALGRHIGSPSAAAVILFAIAFIVALGVTLVTKAPNVEALRYAPKHYFLAGGFVAFYVLSITYIAPHFGVGNAIFFVLLGQVLSAGLIDHFGLFGAKLIPLSPSRLLGFALMTCGIWLTQVSRN